MHKAGPNVGARHAVPGSLHTDATDVENPITIDLATTAAGRELRSTADRKQDPTLMIPPIAQALGL
jgi:hypothetical protein